LHPVFCFVGSRLLTGCPRRLDRPSTALPAQALSPQMSQIFSTVIPVPESAEIRAKGICGFIQG
jgi:hypothetical protein